MKTKPYFEPRSEKSLNWFATVYFRDAKKKPQLVKLGASGSIPRDLGTNPNVLKIVPFRK
jgi:hypothetical protein